MKIRDNRVKLMHSVYNNYLQEALKLRGSGQNSVVLDFNSHLDLWISIDDEGYYIDMVDALTDLPLGSVFCSFDDESELYSIIESVCNCF